MKIRLVNTTWIKMTMISTLCLITSVHAYPRYASVEVIKQIATPDNMTEKEIRDKLIGTWQCTYRDDVMTYDAKLIFGQEGRLTSQKSSQMLTDPIGTAVIHTERDWQVVDNSVMWVLVEQVAKVTHFEVSPSLDSEFLLKDYLDAKPAQESVMSFGEKDGKQIWTRIDGVWGLLLGECIKV